MTLKDDRGETFAVDNDMIDTLLEMGKQRNKQFFDFSKGFAIFITNKDVTERDIKGDGNKIKQFLRDIGYKQRGDIKSNRSKLIR